MVMRRGDDADFKDKMSKKNRELSEYLDEIRVWLTVWDVTESVVLICFVLNYCLTWFSEITENGCKKAD